MSGTNIPLYWNEETQQYESVEGKDGAIKVSGGADGAELATEETLATLAGTVRTTVPIAGDPAQAVTIRDAPLLTVQVAEGQLATATPADDATGIVTRTVGLAAAIPVGEEGTANPVTVLGTASISGEVSQGRGLPPDTSDQWIVATSDGVSAQQIATKAGQDAALTEQQTQTGHLSTIATEVTGVAKDASVQAIEDAVDELEADADASRVAAESIDTKTLTPLGTDFATPVRGTATNVAAQLPSSSTPRGFALENIDSANDLYVGTDNTVTTANGFKISPGRSRRFPLGNPNTLWVISATTTAWQIGAVV